MTTRIRFLGEVPATTVAGTFNTADVSLSIASASGQPSTFPFDAVISRTVPAKRERIRVGGLAGTTYNTITRAIDGTTAKLHDVGETIELCISASYLDELGQFLGGTTGDLYYYGGASVSRLAVGTVGQVARSTGTLPAYSHNVVPVFATMAARDAAIAAPVEAQVAATTTEKRLWQHDGTRWIPIAWYTKGGRPGVSLTAANIVGLANAANQNISWNAEVRDWDGWIAAPGTTLTVPTGHGGIYLIEAAFSADALGTGSNFSGTINGALMASTATSTVGHGLQMTALNYTGNTMGVSPSMGYFVSTVHLEAADAVIFNIANNSGAARTYSLLSVDMTRLSL